MLMVKAYYYIDRRHTSMSCNVQNFVNRDDADSAAWLCATMPGCVSAQVVECKYAEDAIVRVYARGESGFVEDFTDLSDALRQLREAGADFSSAE